MITHKAPRVWAFPMLNRTLIASSNEELEVPTSPRSCRSRTQPTDVSTGGCSLGSLLDRFPGRITGFLFFLFAFPLLVERHTVFAPHLLA